MAILKPIYQSITIKEIVAGQKETCIIVKIKTVRKNIPFTRHIIGFENPSNLYLPEEALNALKTRSYKDRVQYPALEQIREDIIKTMRDVTRVMIALDDTAFINVCFKSLISPSTNELKYALLGLDNPLGLLLGKKIVPGERTFTSKKDMFKYAREYGVCVNGLSIPEEHEEQLNVIPKSSETNEVPAGVYQTKISIVPDKVWLDIVYSVRKSYVEDVFSSNMDTVYRLLYILNPFGLYLGDKFKRVETKDPNTSKSTSPDDHLTYSTMENMLKDIRSHITVCNQDLSKVDSNAMTDPDTTMNHMPSDKTAPPGSTLEASLLDGPPIIKEADSAKQPAVSREETHCILEIDALHLRYEASGDSHYFRTTPKDVLYKYNVGEVSTVISLNESGLAYYNVEQAQRTGFMYHGNDQAHKKELQGYLLSSLIELVNFTMRIETKFDMGNVMLLHLNVADTIGSMGGHFVIPNQCFSENVDGDYIIHGGEYDYYGDIELLAFLKGKIYTIRKIKAHNTTYRSELDLVKEKLKAGIVPKFTIFENTGELVWRILPLMEDLNGKIEYFAKTLKV